MDYDRDGYLAPCSSRGPPAVDYDIKTAPYCGYKKEGYRMYCDPQQFDGMPALSLPQQPRWSFTEVSRKAGVANPAGKGLGAAHRPTSMATDGPDIFVAYDGQFSVPQ